MVLFLRKPLILLLLLLFLGCESKKNYDIGSDKMISDLNIRISSLQEDMTALTNDLDQVKVVLDDKDIDAELRKNIKREVLEGDLHKKKLQQHIDFLKIKRKKRYRSLYERKSSNTLKEEAEKEIKAYFVDKELNPIKKTWNDRFRTAVEL